MCWQLEVNDADNVKMNWERLKKSEKKDRKSVLEGIPVALPALIHAQRSQERASVGFDWPNLKPVLAKLELDEALASEDHPRSRKNWETCCLRAGNPVASCI